MGGPRSLVGRKGARSRGRFAFFCPLSVRSDPTPSPLPFQGVAPLQNLKGLPRSLKILRFKFAQTWFLWGMVGLVSKPFPTALPPTPLPSKKFDLFKVGRANLVAPPKECGPPLRPPPRGVLREAVRGCPARCPGPDLRHDEPCDAAGGGGAHRILPARASPRPNRDPMATRWRLERHAWEVALRPAAATAGQRWCVAASCGLRWGRLPRLLWRPVRPPPAFYPLAPNPPASEQDPPPKRRPAAGPSSGRWTRRCMTCRPSLASPTAASTAGWTAPCSPPPGAAPEQGLTSRRSAASNAELNTPFIRMLPFGICPSCSGLLWVFACGQSPPRPAAPPPATLSGGPRSPAPPRTRRWRRSSRRGTPGPGYRCGSVRCCTNWEGGGPSTSLVATLVRGRHTPQCHHSKGHPSMEDYPCGLRTQKNFLPGQLSSTLCLAKCPLGTCFPALHTLTCLKTFFLCYFFVEQSRKQRTFFHTSDHKPLKTQFLPNSRVDRG